MSDTTTDNAASTPFTAFRSEADYQAMVRERDAAVTERNLAIDRRVAAIRDRDRAEADLTDFKEKVRDRMIQEAEERGWCDEFDQILEEFGLEPRTHDYSVKFRVWVDTEVTVTAKDEDDASKKASEELNLNEGRTYYVNGHGLYVNDIEADEIEQV